MKTLMTFLLLAFTTLAAGSAEAAFKNEHWLKVKYYAYGGSGSGASAAQPASAVDSDIMSIDAGMVVDNCDVVVTSAVTGTITLGDDDDADGYATSTEITEASVGAYVGNGAYVTGGLSKYYASAGKEIKLDATTISAGAFAVACYGYKL